MATAIAAKPTASEYVRLQHARQQVLAEVVSAERVLHDGEVSRAVNRFVDRHAPDKRPEHTADVNTVKITTPHSHAVAAKLSPCLKAARGAAWATL